MDDPAERQGLTEGIEHDGAIDVGLRSRLAGGAIAALLSLGLAAVGTIGLISSPDSDWWARRSPSSSEHGSCRSPDAIDGWPRS